MQAGPSHLLLAPQEPIPLAGYLPPFFSEGPAGQSSGLHFPICAVGGAGLVWGFVECPWDRHRNLTGSNAAPRRPVPQLRPPLQRQDSALFSGAVLSLPLSFPRAQSVPYSCVVRYRLPAHCCFPLLHVFWKGVEGSDPWAKLPGSSS